MTYRFQYSLWWWKSTGPTGSLSIRLVPESEGHLLSGDVGSKCLRRDPGCVVYSEIRREWNVSNSNRDV